MAGQLDQLTRLVTAFRDARDWAQFHSLRSLIVSLNLEAGELLELTQWKRDDEIEALLAAPASIAVHGLGPRWSPPSTIGVRPSVSSVVIAS